MTQLTIGKHTISHERPDCFVIAEVGHNHGGSVETCKQIFQAAKYAGATAVKLQKRDNKSLYTKAFYDSVYNSENAFGTTYGTHREALEFDETQYREVKAFAESLDLVFFATAFDFKSVDFLEKLDVPCYKVASGDLTTIPLLEYIAKTGKPIIMSSGAGTLEDVRRAHDAVMKINEKLSILHCTAEYPCDHKDMNLRVVETYRREFPNVIVGLSDHDNGIAMALVAYVMGARVIEKHFTLNRSWKGTDHAFSLEPEGLRKLVRDIGRASIAIGDGVKKLYEKEKGPKQKMGKMIVASRELAAGHVLQPGDLAFKSPANGLPPWQVDSFYGKPLKRAVTEDEALTFEHV